MRNRSRLHDNKDSIEHVLPPYANHSGSWAHLSAAIVPPTCDVIAAISYPIMPPCAVALHLRIRVKPENHEALLGFLAEARPVYEQPVPGGAITMRLLQQRDDPNAFIEVFEYESVEAYEADDRRIREDPQQRALIDRWRSLLDGPPVVEVYFEQCVGERGPTG